MTSMNQSPEQTPKPLSPPLRWFLLGTGCLAVILAIFGMFLPVLPTVPFLLLAMGCFARSSARFYLWLLEHAQLGPIIRPYLQGGGIPRTSKIRAIALIWCSILFSILMLSNYWIQGGLLVIAVSVTLYLLRLPTETTGDQTQTTHRS